jgi:hypothetical protein
MTTNTIRKSITRVSTPRWVRSTFTMTGTRVLQNHLGMLDTMSSHGVKLKDMASALRSYGHRQSQSTLIVYISQALNEIGVR